MGEAWSAHFRQLAGAARANTAPGSRIPTNGSPGAFPTSQAGAGPSCRLFAVMPQTRNAASATATTVIQVTTGESPMP